MNKGNKRVKAIAVLLTAAILVGGGDHALLRRCR